MHGWRLVRLLEFGWLENIVLEEQAVQLLLFLSLLAELWVPSRSSLLFNKSNVDGESLELFFKKGTLRP